METPKIYLALANFAAKCPTIKKDSVNPHFGNKYASLATIQQTVYPHLAACDLVATHYVEENALTTKIVHIADGSMVVSSIPLSGQKPQDVGSAITYFKRYNLGALLDLDIDDDDDGNAAQSSATKKTGKEYLCQKCNAPNVGPTLRESKFKPGEKWYMCATCGKSTAAYENPPDISDKPF